MARLHLAEIEDQPWCPKPVRDAGTDYLQFVLDRTNLYAPIAPRLRAALVATDARQVLDLCSGGGGPWHRLLPLLQAPDRAVKLRLTDLYPNLPAFERARVRLGDAVSFEATPVDATAVPPRLTGFRTLFSGFHHFEPAQARAILADAVRARAGIGIFEATERKASNIAGMALVPLFVMAAVPFIRPFRLSRALLTYLPPVVPVMAAWDGVVSCLRTYTPGELRELTAGLDTYEWDVGQEKVPGSLARVTYLVGIPKPMAA